MIGARVKRREDRRLLTGVGRYVAAQRAAIEDKKAGIQAKQSQFGVLAQKYGMSGAESIWKQAALDKTAAQADQIAAANGIARSDQNYATVMGKLDADRAKALAQSIQYVQARGGGQQVFDPRIGVPMSVPDYAKWKAQNVGATDLEGVKHEGAVELKMLENSGKKEDKSQAEASELAQRLQQAKVPDARAAAERAEKDLSHAPVSGLKSVAVGIVTPGYLPDSIQQFAANAVLNKNEQDREQSWASMTSAYTNAVTGAGGSDKERADILRAAGAAKTSTQARLTFIANMKERMDGIEANLRAGTSRAGKRAYDTGKQAEQPAAIKEYR